MEDESLQITVSLHHEVPSVVLICSNTCNILVDSPEKHALTELHEEGVPSHEQSMTLSAELSFPVMEIS